MKPRSAKAARELLIRLRVFEDFIKALLRLYAALLNRAAARETF
jgi:hypothetical protein